MNAAERIFALGRIHFLQRQFQHRLNTPTQPGVGTIEIAIGRIQPEIHVQVFSAITLKEKELLLNARLDYDVRKAGIFELRIAFPSELRLVDTIHGDLIDDWRIDKQKQQLIVGFLTFVSTTTGITLSDLTL